MKKFLCFVMFIATSLCADAQEVQMTIVEGIQNAKVKNRMEKGISELLSEINRACAQERDLDLDNGSQRKAFAYSVMA